MSTLIVRPRAWLLIACIATILIAPLGLLYLPAPFIGLEPGERPVRFIVFLWVASAVALVLALWRLLTWTTYRATTDSLEVRTLFGARQYAWTNLISTSLQAPAGVPPAYELKFKTKTIRLIAAHFDQRQIAALGDYAKT